MKQQCLKGMLYRLYGKRIMDIVLALSAIITLAPLLFITWIMVRIKIGSPALFRQKRPGLNDRIFTLYKFRTMTNQRDENGNLLPDELRLTKFGKFLRSTSLDELPELFNILRGDMSVVGPRPLLVQYLPLYNPQQKRRHEVRPGLSGLAQVNGRNTISWEAKFNMDVQYVDNISFANDWKIILLTFKKVLVREGIRSEASSTMEEFKGSQGESKLVG